MGGDDPELGALVGGLIGLGGLGQLFTDGFQRDIPDGLLIGLLMPPEPPASNILIYFAAYFLLALPFLGLGPRLGTSIVQMSGRTPTSIAMHALTLDHLTGGRVILGMGVSGPQVVEGWYGQPFSATVAAPPLGTVWFLHEG